MKGYVRRKGDRWYAVIYEGIDPVTGKERRSWHAAGTERSDAERLAARLAAKANGRLDVARAMTFGTYLQSQWLPAKKSRLRPSTYAGYRRNVELHVLPTLGRMPIRRLRDKQLESQLESLYQRLAHPTDGVRALSPKTVLEIHLIIRAALADALHDEYVARNVALSANVPQPPSVRSPESTPGNMSSAKPSAPPIPTTSSPTLTPSKCIRTRSRKRSSASRCAPKFRSSACTTCATPTRRCS
jgi:Phage integrase, N-terminal SAM-like domain